MNCPHCGHKIDPRTLWKEGARALAAKRKTFSAGRPRTDAPRCPCGAMTAKRAAARKHRCEAPTITTQA